MEVTVVAELAWAVTRAGHPTLRFNYAGIGASQGTFDEGEGARADMAVAAHHLRLCVLGVDQEEATESEPIAAAGMGFGAQMAAEMAMKNAESVPFLFLVSPELERLPEGLSSYRGELVIIVGHQDETVDANRLQALVDSAPNARLTRIPQADRAFLRGLVELGRVVAETLSPPGMIDLG